MSTVDFAALAAPFAADRVSWRAGSYTKDKKKARALAYIDARDTMQRLDAVCTPAGWQCRYSHVGTITVCEIAVRVGTEWLWKANGAGHTDIEGEKGALSDAFKRAAVLWGIGQYLYDIDSPWVEIDDYKQIAKHELPRLRALLDGTKPMTPAQGRKEIDWKGLAHKARLCPSVQALDDFLVGQAEALAQMPSGWRDHWNNEVIGPLRESLMKGRRAA